MKKIIYYIVLNLLCCVIWIILNESLSMIHILVGSILGMVSIYTAEKFLLADYYKEIYTIKPLIIMRWLAYLFYQIYYSGILTIGRIITGRINPGIVEIETQLDNDIYIGLLANSITLTPGTVTIDKSGNKLKVLWLDCVTRDKKRAGEIIKGKFERILMGG